MGGGYLEDATEQRTGRGRKKQSKKKKAPLSDDKACPPAVLDATKRCTRCKEIGHSRPWNKLCQYYEPKRRNKRKQPDKDIIGASPQQVDRDADELDEIDALPLQDPEDDSTGSDFFDARDYCSSTDSGAYFSGDASDDDSSASAVVGAMSAII